LPKDYIPLKKNLTVEEIDQRYQHVQVFDRRDNKKNLPNVNLSKEEFEKHFNALTKMIEEMAVPLIDSYFCEEFNKRYPDYTYGANKKVRCLQDMNEAYGIGPNDLKMREMMYFALVQVWGFRNIHSYNHERTILARLGFMYEYHYSNGQSQKRKMQGGCIKKLVNRKKNTMLGNLRRTGRVRWKESIQKRATGKRKKREDGEKEDSVPRILKIIPAIKDVHGFGSCKRAFLALCDGHPDLEDSPHQNGASNHSNSTQSNRSPEEQIGTAMIALGYEKSQTDAIVNMLEPLPAAGGEKSRKEKVWEMLVKLGYSKAHVDAVFEALVHEGLYDDSGDALLTSPIIEPFPLSSIARRSAVSVRNGVSCTLNPEQVHDLLHFHGGDVR